MKIIEMFTELGGYRTEKDDSTSLKLDDLRKTKLTLKQLNRLRIMNDVRKLEHEQKISQVQSQYRRAPSDSEGGP